MAWDLLQIILFSHEHFRIASASGCGSNRKECDMKKRRFPSFSLSLFPAFAFIVSVLLFPPAPSWSATPIVDDTTFIVNAGAYKAPVGDLDLLILRERVSAPPVDLTPYDNPDPSGIVVTGNPLTFGSPDCIQSILVRLFDGSPSGV